MPRPCYASFALFYYINIFTRDVEAHLYRSGSFALKVTWRKCAALSRTYRGMGRGGRGISIFGSHVGCLAIDAPIRGEGRQIHQRGVTQPDDSCIIYLGLISREGKGGSKKKIRKIFKYPAF